MLPRAWGPARPIRGPQSAWRAVDRDVVDLFTFVLCLAHPFAPSRVPACDVTSRARPDGGTGSLGPSLRTTAPSDAGSGVTSHAGPSEFDRLCRGVRRNHGHMRRVLGRSERRPVRYRQVQKVARPCRIRSVQLAHHSDPDRYRAPKRAMHLCHRISKDRFTRNQVRGGQNLCHKFPDLHRKALPDRAWWSRQSQAYLQRFGRPSVVQWMPSMRLANLRYWTETQACRSA